LSSKEKYLHFVLLICCCQHITVEIGMVGWEKSSHRTFGVMKQ